MGNSGCALLLAGAVGGAGTAVWLSDKLTQAVNAPFDKTVLAVKSALAELDLHIIREIQKDDVAQVISEYYAGQKVWVDIHKMTKRSSRVEVRVGLTGDEEAARKILDQILAFL
jgi:DNA polymerase III delta prime subunit